MRYIAFIHKEPDSVYGVSFPDMPGCVSAGATIDKAVRNAVEALSGHVRLMEADRHRPLQNARATASATALQSTPP